MLLLLFLVHLLTKNGSAAPVALPLNTRAPADSCDNINHCRKLFDIVWGCLATIFACTWVSVHPNVPPPEQTRLTLFWRRLKMMLIGIIAPELLVGFAARQWWGARTLSKPSRVEYNFSRTHGYFFCMGGFVSSMGYPVATKEQVDDPDLGPEFLNGIQNIRVRDIADKSKGDALSKGVALAQGLWFTTQCLARLHQRLAITELEVATLAFAVVNILIWLLWWSKPLDVREPIVIGPPKPPHAPRITQAQITLRDRFGNVILGYTGGVYRPLSSTSVPSFWSPLVDDNPPLGILGITALAGSVFGTIHCAAWNTDFPTAAEMWIWRSCSLVIAAMPVVIFLLSFLGSIIKDTAFGKTKLGYVILTILSIVLVGSLTIYVVSRLILIALPLAALRSLLSSAFVDVNWSTYIPHI
ncbi:hypothetical protein B0H13DRAFT_2369612 [Mycena leptocephala]|nr:hypothetical protein B0H13DRAFT_2369612 [Mycena leptocephala]